MNVEDIRFYKKNNELKFIFPPDMSERNLKFIVPLSIFSDWRQTDRQSFLKSMYFKHVKCIYFVVYL